MKWEDIQQIVRIVAYGVSGFLVNAGQLDPTNGETLGGAILGLVTVGWWWWWNRKNKPAA